MKTITQYGQRVMAISCFLAMALAAQPAFAETPDHPAHHAQASEEMSNMYSGLYFGFTPCADCKGVKTTLALNKSKSYVLMTQFVGKSEREFVEKGKFAFDASSNEIVLTPRDGSAPHYYAVGQNEMIQLDGNGKRFSGEQGPYTLRRKDVVPSGPSAAPSQHGGH